MNRNLTILTFCSKKNITYFVNVFGKLLILLVGDIGVIIGPYNGEVISQMKEDFDKTFAVSREITLEWCKNRPLVTRLAQSIMRIFSPLM